MTTQVATVTKAQDLRNYLYTPTILNQIGAALPKHLSPERVLRQAMTLCQQKPALLDCTQTSILAGIIQASELGLELSGPLGQAYLIPRWNKQVKAKTACFQIGYRGLIDLAWRSGRIRGFTLRTVHAKDEFRVFAGSLHRIEHAPSMEDDPGEAIAYYALVFFGNGGEDFEVMTRAQVEKHRQRYADENSEAWATAYDQMAEKTCAIQLAHRCPVSIEFQRAAMETVHNLADPAQAPTTLSRTQQLLERLPGSEPAPAPVPEVEEAVADSQEASS